jgi:hypothetical protein
MTLSRRNLIGGALAAGTLASVPGTSFAAKPEKRAATVFFKEEALNFQMLFALGGAGYGVSEVGEVLATFDRIHAKGDTYRST